MDQFKILLVDADGTVIEQWEAAVLEEEPFNPKIWDELEDEFDKVWTRDELDRVIPGDLEQDVQFTIKEHLIPSNRFAR